MNALIAATMLALPPLYPVSAVQPGQTGECQTVFEGNAVEPFPFVVKGVMHNFLGPGKDLVLVRLQGDKAEFTGVVAGMSGSPCSIDGKLLGALAYAFGMFSKEPIAGITPMPGMLDVMKLPDAERPWRIGKTADSSDWDAFRTGRAEADTGTRDGLRPIAAPLTMGGVPMAVRDHFDPWLRSVGFEPIAGGTSTPGAQPEPLVPGSAVAAVLVRGDVDIAATGTVTSVEGDEVLAFGHPFFGAGVISLPMANATILNTLASTMRSFKMASTGAVLGEVTQDRLTAIGGKVGRFATMVPVRGTVTTPAGPAPFQVEVARDVALTPRFVAIGMAGALTGRVEAADRGTVRMTGRIEAEGMEPVDLRNVYSAERDGGLFVYSAIDTAMMFGALWNTPFGPPPKMRVSLQATYEPEPLQEWIEAIHVDRGRVVAGQALEVAVRLRRMHGDTSLERFHIQVPRSWVGQEVKIVATGVDGAESIERAVAGNPVPNDIADIGRWLSKRRANGNLYLMAVRKSSGLRTGVGMHEALPPSAIVNLSGNVAHQKRSLGLAWEERRPRPGTVVGQALTAVKVVSKK